MELRAYLWLCSQRTLLLLAGLRGLWDARAPRGKLVLLPFEPPGPGSNMSLWPLHHSPPLGLSHLLYKMNLKNPQAPVSIDSMGGGGRRGQGNAVLDQG